MLPAKRCGPSNGVMEAANMPLPILLAAELDDVDAAGEKVALYAERGDRRFALVGCDLAEVVLPPSEGGSGGRAAFLILGEKYADTAVVGVVRPELMPAW